MADQCEPGSFLLIQRFVVLDRAQYRYESYFAIELSTKVSRAPDWLVHCLGEHEAYLSFREVQNEVIAVRNSKLNRGRPSVIIVRENVLSCNRQIGQADTISKALSRRPLEQFGISRP